MRLFVGVELSDELRGLAGRVAGELQRKLGKTLNARWVAPENMHLTVRFIGHVPDDNVPALVEALTQPLAVAPFDIELVGCGRFPPRGAPRVLWIGLTKGLQPLAALHAEFNRRLALVGHEPENKPFNAHLTLARVKDARAASARTFGEIFESVRLPELRQRVDRVTLFESRLSPRGSHYTALSRVPLRG
jgi:RNA 2',3'-cyclic 3'-phosphodiesterase